MRILCALVALLGPLPGAAAIVQWQTHGIIDLTSGDDTFSLEGAHFSGTYSYDTSTAAAFVNTGFANLVTARYPALTAQVIYTDRPDGAPDLILDLAPTLQTTNVFPAGAPQRDTLTIGTTVVAVEGMGNLVVPSQNVYFAGQDYFPGTDPAPLPAFAAGDVQFFQFGNFAAGGSSYQFPSSTAGFSVQIVPLPAAAWLFLSALGLAAGVRRSRA